MSESLGATAAALTIATAETVSDDIAEKVPFSSEYRTDNSHILRARDLDDPIDPLFVKADTNLCENLSRTQKAGTTIKALVTEGHTVWDSLLSNANASVGQVIQVYPHQIALMGVIPALITTVSTQLLNYYTLWLLIVLFLERKRSMVLADEWYNTTDSHGYRRRKSVTQFADLVGFALGNRMFLFAKLMVAIAIFGSGISQIVASSSSQYTIDKRFNKLEWGLILGAPLLLITFLPGFRSFRVVNVIALTGTNYSCLYFFVSACIKGIQPGIFTRGPLSLQHFFLGAATIAAGGHTYQIEMMDAMRKSRKFTVSAFASLMWNLMLLIPHSYALVLAMPDQVSQQSNVFSILPSSRFKTASVWLMFVHNLTAMPAHTSPLIFLWEKGLGVHEKRYSVRCLARVPLLACWWLVALAIPFYGTINSLFASLTGGMTGFILPCLAFTIYFRTQKRRSECVAHIPRFLAKWHWLPIFSLNVFCIIFFLSTKTLMGITFAIKQLVADIDTFKLFATCYQCPASISKSDLG